ncbi:MAG: group III truncated hemoglobin [Saprospiraceae bacterium]|nr:group III truncated hemoglobin [Saprospiraceae bacterium]
MEKKQDIESREDLEILVQHFYDGMLKDQMLGPIFNEIAQINLETHLPHLVDFWHSMLFLTGAYKRNVMNMHLELHRKTALEKKHFDLWLQYFTKAIDDLFSGPRSQLAKERARSIALLMQVKIKQLKDPNNL